jgi:hypothetical protein
MLTGTTYLQDNLINFQRYFLCHTAVVVYLVVRFGLRNFNGIRFISLVLSSLFKISREAFGSFPVHVLRRAHASEVVPFYEVCVLQAVDAVQHLISNCNGVLETVTLFC